MSAWVVSDYHINALINFAISQRVTYYFDGGHTDISEANAQLTGSILMAENVKSVNHRYNESEPSTYRYKGPARTFTAVEIIKACHCLSYQSCEHDGWETSAAFKIVDAIKNAAEHKLPGYDAAPWGFDDRDPRKV